MFSVLLPVILENLCAQSSHELSLKNLGHLEMLLRALDYYLENFVKGLA